MTPRKPGATREQIERRERNPRWRRETERTQGACIYPEANRVWHDLADPALTPTRLTP